MATDIAFALGILALLGSRAPFGLRVFLTALAIIDDLIAVLVIAAFYTGDLALGPLAAAGALVVALVAANALGVRRPIVYGLLGVALWLAVLQSGVHATIAGVLLAFTIPARRRVDVPTFVSSARDIVDDLDDPTRGRDSERIGELHSGLWELETVAERAQSPMLRIEHALHPWVAFVIVPVFALANAGIAFPGDIVATLRDPIVIGIVIGLVVGKQVGITAAAWLVVRSGLASLPAGVRWWHIYGAAWLGGIGFTMSLFVGELAYGSGEALDLAKIGVLVASVVAGAGGYLVLRRASMEAR
jgi:NhaA family Na+:H+ antiporter